MKITLVGGHGKVALLTEPLLVEQGHSVRAVIRDPDQVGDVEATGATAVVADVETLGADGWDDLLRDAEAVVWSAGAGGGDAERTYRVDRDAAKASMDAAERVGARRYLMVSFHGASLDHGLDPQDSFYPYAQAKAEADEHLRRSGLSWTILGPGTLTEDDGAGRIEPSPAEGGDTSRANVARVLVEALARDDLGGAFIEFRDGDVPIADALSRS